MAGPGVAGPSSEALDQWCVFIYDMRASGDTQGKFTPRSPHRVGVRVETPIIEMVVPVLFGGIVLN